MVWTICYTADTMESEPRRQIRPMPSRFTRAEMRVGYQAQFDAVQKAEDRDAARAELMATTRATAARFFKGRESLVAPVLEEMDALLAAGDERFAEVISDRLGAIFEELYRDPAVAEEFHAQIRTAEQEERARIIEWARGIPLSPRKVLYGMLDTDDDETFRIHIAVAKTLEPVELAREFQGGMRELARQAEKNPTLTRIQKIVGTSWIVGESPSLAERMGFHLAERDLTDEEKAAHFSGEKRRVRESWMTRDELIEKFGEKKSS